jgi:Tol biopolymer transport system component
MKASLVLMACAAGASLLCATGARAEAPRVFAPGVISGPSNDADAAFAPDGATLLFSRDGAILVSTKSGDGWSAPRVAPFSGRWMDAQPTMAPDGSSLVFVSNRPVAEGDAKHPGGNLWRVDRHGDDWGEPTHLPATVNRTSSIWGPSIAADGSLYFMDRVDGKGPFRLWRSQARGGDYLAAEPVSFGDPTTQDVDPAVAPDESFIVFSSKHPAGDAHERLFIAFRDGAGWGRPIDLGDAVNGTGGNDSNESRLAPDGRTLYFSSDRQLPVTYPRTLAQAAADLARIAAWDNGNQNIWSVSLAPWLDAAKKPG